MDVICILVRDFATTQEKRLNPRLSDVPLILIEAGKYRPRVIAPDAVARQAGVKAGMWLGEAHTLCPQAETLPVDEQRYQRLFFDMTCDLLNITDRIEPEYQATSAGWYSDDLPALGHLQTAIDHTSGIQPQIGIASNKFPARVAAAVTTSDQVCEIASGNEAAFLSTYPVSLLPLDKTMQRRLPLLGIHTLGQLANLPRIAIWEQFGKHGRWLHDLANGQDIRPLMLFKAPVTLTQVMNFDEPIMNRQILYRTLEQFSLLLARELQGHEGHRLSLMLTLTDGMLVEHHRYPHQAVRDNLYLLRLLTQMLDGLLIEAPVESLEVRLTDIRERLPVQLSLFDTCKPIVSLQEIAAEWAMRHRRAEFYHCRVSEERFLPEEAVERQRVSGA